MTSCDEQHTAERGEYICFVSLGLHVVGFHFPQCDNGDAMIFNQVELTLRQ